MITWVKTDTSVSRPQKQNKRVSSFYLQSRPRPPCCAGASGWPPARCPSSRAATVLNPGTPCWGCASPSPRGQTASLQQVARQQNEHRLVLLVRGFTGVEFRSRFNKHTWMNQSHDCQKTFWVFSFYQNAFQLLHGALLLLLLAVRRRLQINSTHF